MVYLANELGFEKDANAIAVYADQEKENLNDLAMDEFVLEQDGLGFFK